MLQRLYHILLPLLSCLLGLTAICASEIEINLVEISDMSIDRNISYDNDILQPLLKHKTGDLKSKNHALQPFSTAQQLPPPSVISFILRQCTPFRNFFKHQGWVNNTLRHCPSPICSYCYLHHLYYP